MRPELVGDVQAALAVIGALLQFLRANKVQDRVVLTLGAAVALTVWALAVDWSAIADWQAFLLRSLPTIGSCVTSLFGGTFLMSKGASATVAAGMDPSHPMVPVTNNKG